MTLVKRQSLTRIPSSWLIVDDNKDEAIDLKTVITDMLLIQGNSPTVEIARNLADVKKQLKRKRFDVAVVDYYYNSISYTGSDIILSIREHFSFMLVMGFSSSCDPSVVQQVLSSGADGFFLKESDYRVYRRHVSTAVVQALYRNNQKHRSTFSGGSNLYWPHAVKTELAISSSRLNESTLLVGNKGTGKSTAASYICKEFMESHNVSDTFPVKTVKCRNIESSRIEDTLFGKPNSPVDISVFESTAGGILVLEDIEFLPKLTFGKVCEIFRKGYFITPDGYRIMVNRTKVIVTLGSTHNTDRDSSIKDIALNITDRTISLPSLSELRSSSKQIVSYILQPRSIDVSFDPRYVARLVELVSFSGLDENFSSLHKIINSSISKATSESRSYVSEFDLSYAPENVDFSKILKHRGAAEFFRLLSEGKDLKRMKQLLDSLAFLVAEKEHSGDKSKMAESLNVTRQTVYAQSRKIDTAVNLLG